MSLGCRISHRNFFAGACACLLMSAAARAALVDEVRTFLDDRDRLIGLRTELSDDRAALAANINDATLLTRSARDFFTDRASASSLKVLKALDRREVKFALSYKGAKIIKPVKGTGVLAQDAASYIASFDQWEALRAMVEANLEQMRSDAAANNEAALMISAKSFFDNSRLRLQARLQWQSDIRAMKKDTAFRGIGKASLPPGTTLAEHTAEFLSDRVAWEALGEAVNAARNNLRATLTDAGSLESSVTSFLTNRRARRVKGIELSLDRKAMAKDIAFNSRSGGREFSAKEPGAKDIDQDEEEGALEESSDEAGE
jgi:hypothetical protein